MEIALWRRLPINQKLFYAITITTVLTVCFMAALIAYSMRAGFAQYLIEVELSRFDEVAATLALLHDENNPGWPELNDNAAAWVALSLPFMREQLQSRPAGEGIKSRSRLLEELAAAHSLTASEMKARDPLMLSQRLSLHDANDRHISGADHASEVSGRRPIEVIDSSGRSSVAGWLVLAAPQDRPWVTDSIFVTDDLFLNRQLWAVILSAMLAVFLSGIAAFLVSRQFTRPVSTLKDNARKLASGEFSQRMSNVYEDEFGALIDDFNALAENLQQTKELEAMWIANAAHELRTPVSMLRAQIEAMQDGVHQIDEKTLGLLHRSVLRLAHLIDDLNIITSEQERNLMLSLDRACLSEIVSERVSAAEGQMAAQGLDLTIAIQPDIWVQCDPIRIGQLVDNLVENSRRYTDRPGTIAVSLSLTADDTAVVLIVEDSPPAPAAASLGILFDRFFRAELSRARHLGGSGLGLSICEAIVISHHGTISAQFSALGGLKIEARWPTQEQANDQA